MPTSSPPLDRSANRVDALVQLAAEIGQRSTGSRMGRRRSAWIGLGCLAAFARTQFDFLRAGLQPGGSFEADDRFPLEFLIEATARQVSFDMDVFLRAVNHRETATATAAMRETLDAADRLATDAILPAVRHALVEPTVMLTYFQKSPTIRLMPYVPLALIGIDFSALGDHTRLLAIAHETGHHVYRQVTANYTAHLDEQIAAMATPAPASSAWPTWLLAWEEEIFADIYAALVAGPAAALALHEIIQTGARASLVEDDGDHPLDALRPQILHTTLRTMAAQASGDRRKKLSAAADALDARWQEVLSTRGAPETFTPAGGDAPVSLAEASALLRSLVEGMLGGALAPLVADADHTPWSLGATKAKAVAAESYAQFAEATARLAGAALPELALRNNAALVAVANYPIKAKGGQRSVGSTGDDHLDTLRSAGLGGAKLTALEWKAVFLAGDWTTQEGGSGIKPPVFSPTSWWLTSFPTTPTRPTVTARRR